MDERSGVLMLPSLLFNRLNVTCDFSTLFFDGCALHQSGGFDLYPSISDLS